LGRRSHRAPVAFALFALTGYGAYTAVQQLGLWKSVAVLAGIVAAVASFLNDWPQIEDIRG
jgi:hypothetical protein